VPGSGLAADLGDRGRERLAHRLLPGIALPQDPDPLVLLGQVGQVEVDGERAGHVLGALQGPGGDEPGDRVPGRIAAARVVLPPAPAGVDDGVPEPLHVR